MSLFDIEPNNINLVKQILKENPNALNDEDDNQRTPLMYAALKGHEEVVELFLKKNSDPAHVDSEGNTALMWAAVKGHDKVVQLLLGPGVNSKPGHANTNGDTALMWAVANGHDKVVQLLLGSGVNSNPGHANTNGNTALILAALKGHEEVVELLLKKNSDPAHVDSEGNTALMWAAVKGHDKVVQLLLGPGVNSNPGHANTNGDTALMWAVANGHVKVIELLLGPGVNSNPGHANTNGDTALILAADLGFDVLVEQLLGPGVNSKPEQINYVCRSALHYVYDQYTTTLYPSWLKVLVKLIQYIYQKYKFNEEETLNLPNLIELKEKVLPKPNDNKELLIQKYNNKSTEIYYKLLLQICKKQANNEQLKVALIEQKVDFMHFCNIQDTEAVASFITGTHIPRQRTDGIHNNTRSKRKASPIKDIPTAKKKKVTTGENIIDFYVNHIRNNNLNRVTVYNFLKKLIQNKEIDEKEAEIIHDEVYSYNMGSQHNGNYTFLSKPPLRGGSVKKRTIRKKKRTIRKKKRTIRKQ